MAVFSDIAPYNLVETDRPFLTTLLHRSDDGYRMCLWNVSQFISDCTTQNPRRQQSSYSYPREPEMSPKYTVICKYQIYVVQS
jgi:hypothetical protein